MLSHDTWLTYSNKLSVKDLPKELQPLYSVLDNFHSQNPDVNLTVADLANLVLAQQVKDPSYYNAVFQQLESLSASDTTTQVLLRSFYDRKLLKEISLAAYEITEGKGSREALDKLIASLSQGEQPQQQDDVEFVTDDLESLLNETYRNPGLRWRLETLNKMLGSLRAGDFGFIFARPETGKTTFLADQTTFMAQQLTESDGPVLWFKLIRPL